MSSSRRAENKDGTAICMAGEQVVRCTEGLIYYTGYSVPVLIAMVVGLLMTFLATRTMFGRYVYAIGGNPEAAELAGINTKWMIVKVFALMGTLVGISSIVSSARLNAATNALGGLNELYVIAATVIGGTSLAGGVGTIYGAMLGALDDAIHHFRHVTAQSACGFPEHRRRRGSGARRLSRPTLLAPREVRGHQYGKGQSKTGYFENAAKAVEFHDSPTAVKGREPHETTKERGTPLIEMRDISIAFGGIKAVDHASVDLYPGEVVGLLGHNGAGKSTLIKVLSGAYKRDAGQIFLNGSGVSHHTIPRDAKAQGIETIYQTLALADNVDAAANLYLGRELKTAFGTLDDVAMEAECRKVMHQAQSQFPPLQGTGVEAFGRPTPVSCHCTCDPFQRPHPDHGRTHGSAWPAGNGAGGRTHQATQGRRHRHLPDQP